MPTPLLDKLWPEWLALHLAAKDHFSAAADEVAQPFASAAHESWPTLGHRFMLVGQATWHGWFEERPVHSLSVDASLQDRQYLNRKFIRDDYKNTAFWRAFEAGGEKIQPTSEYENSVWTNLGKIGFMHKNITKKLMNFQADLATRTLKCELETYKPTLVHFVTNSLGDESILEATCTRANDWQTLDPPNEAIWFLIGKDASMLWTRHPNRAPQRLVGAWNDKLKELAQTHGKMI